LPSAKILLYAIRDNQLDALPVQRSGSDFCVGKLFNGDRRRNTPHRLEKRPIINDTPQ
jgi:hypothetical protein